MDYEQARFNMVESQVRTWEVLDQKILSLLFKVRREDFVPPSYRSLAFVDMEIPLGHHGEVMLAPKLEARLLQEVDVQPGSVVLEVGSGSGYMTALLAALAAKVHSVEIRPELHQMAARNLHLAGISNASLYTGDAARGWKAQAPYDVIVLTGSAPVLSNEFLQQLNVGGRLIAVMGKPPIMTARLIVRTSADAFSNTGLFETNIASLRNAPQPESFVF
ncbi:MAG: protein-L-isoaspartate O-methyltransferase [Betaproteobacteria bacterium]|nr:protein-L-isoaspartate O-methyltransferase [Betaproteobacteria bacterium]